MFKAVLLALTLLSSTCWAYYDVLDTGEMLPKGTYKLTGDAQLLTETGGLNVGASIDTSFRDEYGARALVGFGRTDYFMGALFKWAPIPDIDNQPAIGFNLGLLYAHWNGNADLTVRFEPIISKKFTIERSVVTPYASVPLGLRMRTTNANTNTSDLTAQLVLGSQLQVEKWKNLQFIGEIGLDLGNALSSISLAAIWYFDVENGFQLK
jgi:hypothetical protein